MGQPYLFFYYYLLLSVSLIAFFKLNLHIIKINNFIISIDSGLSLTTVRDATEVESDHDTNLHQDLFSRNSKQHRSMPNKRNNDDTDSDDVFDEVFSIHIKKAL